MNIVLTGSLGNIGQPLTQKLVQQGHAVTVISSKADRQAAIEALGATAAIGALEDVAFLTATFTGADSVYCMVPPNYFTEPDLLAYYRKLGHNYAQAIRQAGVKRVVNLSSFGADLDKGTGNILGAHFLEEIFNEQLFDVALTHLRPTYFYYNTLGFIPMIKGLGFIRANYGGADKIPLVSPVDIAAAAAEELQAMSAAQPVRYVASDECTGDELARVLGEAIGRPDLRWVVCPDAQMQADLEQAGLPVTLATHLVDMYRSLHSGALAADYFRHRPAVLGHVKLPAYAAEFAAAYRQQ